MKPEGLIMRWSPWGPVETMDRVVAAVALHGMNVFARIDHSALASAAGMQLRPREVLLFGNPRAGTPLMQSHGTLAIDLPLKAMVWQDDADKTCLAYYDPVWLAERHGVSPDLSVLVEKMKTAVTEVVRTAIGDAKTGGARG